MKCFQPINRKQAFTLVESLVVMLILAVLVALVVPKVKSFSERSKAIYCANNLKNYAAAGIAYSADNNGAIPAFNRNGDGFQRFLQNYPNAPKPKEWIKRVCPAFLKYRQKATGESPPNSFGPPWSGYYTNRYFGDSSGKAGAEKDNSYEKPGRLSQITEPAKTPLYFDADLTIKGENYAPYLDLSANGHATDKTFWPAHGIVFNILFVDGHLEQVPFNSAGPGNGLSPADYPQFIWKPY